MLPRVLHALGISKLTGLQPLHDPSFLNVGADVAATPSFCCAGGASNFPVADPDRMWVGDYPRGRPDRHHHHRVVEPERGLLS